MGNIRKGNNQIIRGIKALGFAQLAAAIISLVLLLVMAFLLDKLGPDEGVIRWLVYGIYMGGGLTAGMLAGKIQGAKKFIWGFMAGLLWFLIILIISLIWNKGSIDTQAIFGAFLCMAGGGLAGGMVA